MKILFLSISTAIKDLRNRGIYPDLINYFVDQGHELYIVCPAERRLKIDTALKIENRVSILTVKTLNITKSGFIEKGLATLMIEKQFDKAIQTHLKNQHFDLILYTTPPITFNSLISKLKKTNNAKTYLLLKDIFPQNAVDLNLIKKNGLIYRYFRRKEEKLYAISDHIGCMSQANVDYVLKNNAKINPEKVEICPNSIKIMERNKILKKEDFLKKYDLPQDIPLFLYAGNLGIAQGIEFLINVIESNKSRKDLFFLIIGGGNKFELLQNYLSKNKIENVKLLPYLDKKEYDTIEHYCDVGMIFLEKKFTIPNFPSRMLSYMECKLPLLIATDKATDIGEIAGENNFGLWSEAGDLEDFNINLNHFTAQIESRKEMGLNGFEFLKKNYNVAVSYQIIMNHFE